MWVKLATAIRSENIRSRGSGLAVPTGGVVIVEDKFPAEFP